MRNQGNNVDLSSALAQSKQNIVKQASMAIIAIVVCIVLCFALTVAWYSNVLHTSDLAFKAKDWDFKFEGDITIGNDGILASPGESGIIPLSVENVSGDGNATGTKTNVETIGVKVNIDKTDLSFLAPRIYFYVDEQKTMNDEVVDRQYITLSQAYTYTIYPGQKLEISEEYSNQPELKWEWVYDVLGYYVYMEDNKIIEYIKPIEYDTDLAIYNTKGELLSVGGVDVDTFITEKYLLTDGFVGPEFNEKTKEYTLEKENGLYKVSENIYIQLCTYEQIQANNTLDTALADPKNVDTKGYPARLVLTGQKANEKTVSVASTSDFIENINKGYDVLEVEGNITLTQDLVVEEGTNVMIDLNGYTLFQESTITANEGSTIGFMNGTIQGNKDSNDQVFINSISAQVNLDNVILTDFYSGIEVQDKDCASDSYIYISNSEITTKNSGIWVRGNGDKSARKTTLVIDNCDLISSEFVPVGTNGSLNMSGIEILVENSNLIGLETAIYHPSTNSNLTIINSTLEGKTGLVIKAGHVVIEDSTIRGTGDYEEPQFLVSGFSTPGDGIYIEDNYVTQNGYECTLTINGEKTNVIGSKANTLAIRVYEGTSKQVGVVVNGGTFSSSVSHFLPQDGSKVQHKDVNYTVYDKPANQ